jgi:hypothetical protein
MAKPYILPNRKAFADAITRMFLRANYRKGDVDPLSAEEAGVDLCIPRSRNTRELFPYQKLVRDYLLIETPYRGLLLYHGLGSGKTCSSIAVAESLLTTQKVFVMLPASLEDNYRGEIRKCGDPIYAFSQHWVLRELSDETRREAIAIGIPEGFLDRTGRFYATVPDREANWDTLSARDKDTITAQIESVIDSRFTFIRYNGLSQSNIAKYAPEDKPNPYENSVVIIDEAHNFIRAVSNESDIGYKLYKKIYEARNCKVVCLSGTPVINSPHEIAYLMNLLRGPIERIIVPFKEAPTWDEEKFKTALKAIPDIDVIEFNAMKKLLLLTRNPPNFRSVYNEAGERTAVQYIKDMVSPPVALDWVNSWKSKFETDIGGGELDAERVKTEMLECLPSNYEEFESTFLQGLEIKNPLLFQRRIQGLVSYFKGADERLLPRRVEDDKMLEKVEMSMEQFNNYLQVRWGEMKADASRRKNAGMNDDMGSYRVNSRLACNYAIPPDLRRDNEDAETEDGTPEKAKILAQLRDQPDRYLSERSLATFSPKMLKILKNIQASLGDRGNWNNQFLYSQYTSLEGIGVFTAILDANGWQPYRIIQDGGQWIEDPTMDPEKPAYALFTGGKGMVSDEVKSDFSTVKRDAIKRSATNSEIREYMRQIFNRNYEDSMPPSLKASVEGRGSKLLCLMMASSSGAEGITLADVRHVHIMEPHWTPARHDQVIGRAIRICSHAKLPMEERTVRISFYLSVFTDAQTKMTEGADNIVPIRRADTKLKRYDGDPPVETFMSTDEYLYNITYMKDKINQRISILLKQSAVDCEVHRKLHSREKPVISCMRFDTTVKGEDLAYRPNIKNDDMDETYMRNMSRKRRRLQKVSIKGIVFYVDPDTNEVFDGPAFDDQQRLLRLGIKTSPTQIRWIIP